MPKKVTEDALLFLSRMVIKYRKRPRAAWRRLTEIHRVSGLSIRRCKHLLAEAKKKGFVEQGKNTMGLEVWRSTDTVEQALAKHPNYEEYKK